MNYKKYNDRELIYLISEKNEDAYNLMYAKYAPLIRREAAHYYKHFLTIGIEYDDLYQDGMYALGEAIRNYNGEKNSLFYTLAIICIKREMQKTVNRFKCHKNILNNRSLSLNTDLSDGFRIEDVVYNIDDITENVAINSYNKMTIYNLRYSFSYDTSLVYELKINGFSNQEISKLLDIDYKKVDNAYRIIKNKIKKLKQNNRLSFSI